MKWESSPVVRDERGSLPSRVGQAFDFRREPAAGGGSSTTTGIKTMHNRDDQTGSGVGDQRCAQTRSHAPLTSDNAQPTTGPKPLRLRYERVKPFGSIICGDLPAKSLILHMAQMGEGRSRAIATGAFVAESPSHEQQVPPLGLPPRQAQNRRPSGIPVSPRSGMTKRERELCEERTARSGKRVLGFQRVARGGQPVHAPPDQAVDGHYHDGHDDRRSQQQIEIAGVASPRDGSAQTNCSVRLVLQPKVLGDDASVPRAPGSGDQTGDEIRKDSGQNESAPALAAFELEQVRRFSQIGRNRHGARDYVEQNVPLRSQQQKQDGTEPQT